MAVVTRLVDGTYVTGVEKSVLHIALGMPFF